MSPRSTSGAPGPGKPALRPGPRSTFGAPRLRRLGLALGLAALVATGAAAAQQPPPPGPPGQPPPPRPQPAQPAPGAPGLPAGHPPIQMQPPPGGQPGQPGQLPPGVQRLPGRPGQLPPGRPVGPGGQPFPPGRQMAPPPAHTPPPKAAAPEHCPGHGPTDPPHPPNWWQGLIGVNNERAVQGGAFDKLLWRYHNEADPCDPKNQPPPFLASVLNVGLLAFILYRFGKKPLSEALVRRKQEIMRDIDNATRLREEAERRLHEYEEKFETVEQKLDEFRAEHAAQAEVEKKLLLAEAEERRARMRRDAEFRVEQELKAARAELLQETVKNAVAAAEELVRQRATQDDQERLAEQYLAAIPGAVGGSARALGVPGMGAST